MEELFNISAGQLLILAGLGVVLLVALFTLGRALKMTATFVKVGCVAVLILFAIILVALWALGG
ncbi:MAG: hypothetical protein U9R15_19490 [Chloroflexota bacterium]|nr:hypothetical protein [Chloroflexota bacterium]